MITFIIIFNDIVWELCNGLISPSLKNISKYYFFIKQMNELK
jgi:hypothetical protein